MRRAVEVSLGLLMAAAGCCGLILILCAYAAAIGAFAFAGSWTFHALSRWLA